MIRPTISVLVVCIVLAGCSTPVSYEDTWLDHPDVTDPFVTDSTLLVSMRTGLTPGDRARPVIIGVHGFTASTYEWAEFRSVAESSSDVLVSLVLLGAHGRSVDEFENSTWRDWARPILAEYDALIAQGYTNISLAGSSTGGTLILEKINARAFDDAPPNRFFFIDPIVVPGNKSLTMIDFVGPFVGNFPNDEMTEAERAHWYTNRPAKALQQLYEVARRVENRLADGFRLPAGSAGRVYKSAVDDVADPVSALLIYKGLRDATGRRIEVEMIESDLHVFTRLQGRDPSDISERDVQHQQRVFQEIITEVSASP